MATYFHGNSELQGPDGLQTLVLMNPGYAQYSDAPPQNQNNFVFLNHAPPQQTLHHAPPQQAQQFSGVPQHDAAAIHGFAAPPLPRGAQYNLCGLVDQNAAAREVPRVQQGLSLSLSSQQAASGVTGGAAGMQGVLMSSKYLKAAQELLDEVVNVGNNNVGVNKSDSPKKIPNGQGKAVGESSAAGSGDGSVTAEASGKSSSELSMVERQEIQMKKAKLITMLDEVEQRYRQYHHQMQVVTSSFEQVAGAGSAKTYTALALQTISKQFRCLKDAIAGQLRAASKSLGEEDQGGSRLRFVDHTLRQQRALQQLGMVQHNAWRPQRGLPERSVSVLRAWLFEHFLHPYPKDSDKHMLAKQTGLTRSQVSNWFINARVRLWKPMVEEMYMEELKDQQHNASDDKTSTKPDNNKEDSSSMLTHDKVGSNPERKTTQNHDDPSTSPIGGNPNNNQQSLFTLIGSSGLEMAQASPKKPRQGRDEYTSMGGPGPANFIGGFGQYPIGEIGRFEADQYPPRFSGNSNNGVSLTLGLPHSHQSFLPNRSMSQLGGAPGEFGSFDGIEIQNRKRFAAQLLPDFVA